MSEKQPEVARRLDEMTGRKDYDEEDAEEGRQRETRRELVEHYRKEREKRMHDL